MSTSGFEIILNVHGLPLCFVGHKKTIHFTAQKQIHFILKKYIFVCTWFFL